MIGIIIVGLIDQSFTTFMIGAALLGLGVAVAPKTLSWLRQRSQW